MPIKPVFYIKAPAFSTLPLVEGLHETGKSATQSITLPRVLIVKMFYLRLLTHLILWIMRQNMMTVTTAKTAQTILFNQAKQSRKMRLCFAMYQIWCVLSGIIKSTK